MQKTVAQILGVDPSTVSNWFRRKHKPMMLS